MNTTSYGSYSQVLLWVVVKLSVKLDPYDVHCMFSVISCNIKRAFYQLSSKTV